MALTLFFYLLPLTSWPGGLFFFLLTPGDIFGALPLPDAGRVLAALFPRYYMLGYIAGAIASLLAIYITAAHPPRLWWGFARAALVIALVLTLYAGVIIRPRVD